MCNINHTKFPFSYTKFPCRICVKNVHDNDKAVQCDLCELWIHIKCNNLNYLDCKYLQNCDEFWYCMECCSTGFPFNSCCTSTDSDNIQWKDVGTDHKIAYYINKTFTKFRTFTQAV